MSKSRETSVGVGVLGTSFALLLSWTTWHSFWWGILHGFFGWFYVGYYFLIANYDQIGGVL